MDLKAYGSPASAPVGTVMHIPRPSLAGTPVQPSVTSTSPLGSPPSSPRLGRSLVSDFPGGSQVSSESSLPQLSRQYFHPHEQEIPNRLAASPGSTTMELPRPKISLIPEEIRQHILSFLNCTSLKHARLACSVLDHSAQRILFSTITCHDSPAFFQTLTIGGIWKHVKEMSTSWSEARDFDQLTQQLKATGLRAISIEKKQTSCTCCQRPVSNASTTTDPFSGRF
jgi:hypothetical protein